MRPLGFPLRPLQRKFLNGRNFKGHDGGTKRRHTWIPNSGARGYGRRRKKLNLMRPEAAE